MKYPTARRDTKFTPLPSPLPVFPAAGNIFRDPSFNSNYPPQYARVTDESIQPANDFIMSTGFSAFSLDDHLLWFTNDGASIFVFEVVPETMKTGLCCILPSNISYGNGHWSQVNPNWFYTINPITCQLWRVDFTGISASDPNNNPPAVMLFDFTTVIAGAKNATFVGVGGNDTVFAAYFGGQDTADCHLVGVYNSFTQQCTVLDTNTAIPGTPFFMHGARLPDPTGMWMWVTPSLNNPPGPVPLYAWAVGSPLVLPIGQFSDGHAAGNEHGFFNNASYSPKGFPSMLFRRWVDFSTANVIELNNNDAPFDPTLDLHPTCTAKNGFIFASTYDVNNTQAYQNEIIAWPPTPGKVLRFGRTFNSSAPTEIFQGQNALGAVSPSGRFYAFTSDCEQTLLNQRCDVFILALPQ